MKKILTIILISSSLFANAQISKLSVTAGVNYGTPLNYNLNNTSGKTIGLQYEIGKKSNLTLNYNSLSNSTKYTLVKSLIETKYLTFGYQHYVNKKKNLYIATEVGTLIGNSEFKPVVTIGFGYTKQLSSKVSLDIGTKFFITNASPSSNTNWLLHATLKFRL